jgi:hypothetical protein
LTLAVGCHVRCFDFGSGYLFVQEPEIPVDAVGPGATIRRQQPPPVSDQYVLVQVSNVINPGLFDIQLVGKETSEALDELMTIMQ